MSENVEKVIETKNPRRRTNITANIDKKLLEEQNSIRRERAENPDLATAEDIKELTEKVKNEKTFAQMIGEGVPFRPYPKSDFYFEIAPFSLRKLPEMGQMMSELSLYILAEAVVRSKGKEEEEFDELLFAKLCARYSEEDFDEENSKEEIERHVATAILNPIFATNQDKADLMIKFATVILQKKHPEITEEIVGEFLDYSSFVRLIQCVFKANTNLQKRF